LFALLLVPIFYKMKNLTLLLCLVIWAWCGLQGQEYLIGARNLETQDLDRLGRTVRAQVYYPADSTNRVAVGPHPVVIFAPGAATDFVEYTYLWRRLVTDGYILVMLRAEPLSSYDPFMTAGDMAFAWNWLKRENESASARFFQRVDTLAMAAMGHGHGGSSALSFAATQPSGLQCLLTLAVVNDDSRLPAIASQLDVPYLSISAGADCLAPFEAHQSPLLEAATAAPYTSWISIRKGMHCYFGSGYDGYPCVEREKLVCNRPLGSISHLQQQSLALLAIHPWVDFFLKTSCDAWDEFYDFASSPDTHDFKDWGQQPSPRASFETSQTGSVVAFLDQSRSGFDYLWEFGDGNFSEEQSPLYVYKGRDSAKVQLRVWARNGCVDSTEKLLTDLPSVAFLGIKAESSEQGVRIEWATETESANEFFAIDRSLFGAAYEEIARFSGQERSMSRRDYEFLDKDLNSGVFHYRLRQEDIAGRVFYSDPLRVQHQLGALVILAQSSYEHDQQQLRVELLCEYAQPTEVTIFSPHGQNMSRQSFDSKSGLNTLFFPLQDLHNGLYIIVARQKREVVYRKLWLNR
jgi:PKD repeat protein